MLLDYLEEILWLDMQGIEDAQTRFFFFLAVLFFLKFRGGHGTKCNVEKERFYDWTGNRTQDSCIKVSDH